MTSLTTTPAHSVRRPRTAIRFTPAGSEPGDARRRLLERLPLAAAGPVPVTLIAGSAFGLDLRVLALLILAPVVAGILARMAVHPPTRRLVARAFGAGILATSLYDLCRGGFLWSGLIHHDPIPHIGRALGLHPAWLFGYTWRYLGNGTGLALTFLALGLRGTRVGVVYGLAVASGLLLTLLISPYGTTILFPLTVPSVTMIVLGHAIYGSVLGTIAARRHARKAEPSQAAVGTLTLSWPRPLALSW
jgi:hypothetical protein